MLVSNHSSQFYQKQFTDYSTKLEGKIVIKLILNRFEKNSFGFIHILKTFLKSLMTKIDPLNFG